MSCKTFFLCICLRFSPQLVKSEKNVLPFLNPISLYFVKSRSGRQVILNLMLQSMGFHPEHTRFDRDNYIDVIWKNI